jgi:hypothetical protein
MKSQSAHRFSGSRRVVLAIVLAVAMTITWAAAASASKDVTATDHARLATALVTPTAKQVSALIVPASQGDPLSELQLHLMSRFSGSFGGIYVDKSGQFVVATDGSPPAAMRQSVEDGFATVARVLGSRAGPRPLLRVGYADTGATLQHLYELKAAILDNPSLRRDGIDGAGLDVERGRVVVMTGRARGAAAVKADYGSQVEVLRDSGSALTDGRYNDSPAWNGGDEIVTPSYGETTCTSGFGMQDAETGQTYLLTAGHCGSATWYNTGTNDPVYDSGTLIGKTLAGSVMTRTIDAQLVTTDSSCISWGDKSTKTSNDVRIYVSGWDDPPQGAAIETEGAVSLEEKGTVAYYDVSKVIAGESLDDLDLVTAVGIGGDSGGPLIYPTIFGPLAGGTEVGWYESGDNSWGVFQLIDAEMYVFTALTGDQIVPVTASTPSSC